MKLSGRMQREAATVETMIRRYCQKHHHSGSESFHKHVSAFIREKPHLE